MSHSENHDGNPKWYTENEKPEVVPGRSSKVDADKILQSSSRHRIAIGLVLVVRIMWFGFSISIQLKDRMESEKRRVEDAPSALLL